MEEALNKMNDDARPINEDAPWDSANAAALDRKTTLQWIDDLKLDPMCRLGVIAELQGNNGQAIERQSYLGNLAQVKGGGCEKYWTESEVYRCKGGNQQLAMKLAEKIGNQNITLGLPVSGIDGQRDKMIITCRDGRTIEVDDVVLAVPPSTWQKIQFNPGLPAMLNPQMGVNVKYLAALKKRFWKELKLAPDCLTDEFLSMSWEGTDAQEGEEGACLNCFSGGPPAQKALDMFKGDRDTEYGKLLEAIYPGFKTNFVKSRFMDWPNEQWTGAGYSFPAPGQVTTIGPVLYKGLGRLHFAGEHASYKFVGYMEGALNCGAAVAQRLAKRDGIVKQTTTQQIQSTQPTQAPALVK